MNEIIVKTQQELDALPASFAEFTTIQIISPSRDRLVVRVARENSNVVARENSNVEAWGNSKVVARENSKVVAWGNSKVVARENSKVVARENSNVEAWGKSKVVAWGNVSIHNFSAFCSLELHGFAVAWLIAKAAKCLRRSKTCTVIIPKTKNGTHAWLEREGIESTRNAVILFKRVSKDFRTQENTINETVWVVGETLIHPNYNPKQKECSPGKFHACSRPYFCDEFRSIPHDKYIAINIAKKDLYAWPNADYPHKIAFRKGTVLYECNKFGKEIKS